jgi:head-tail adaptor
MSIRARIRAQSLDTRVTFERKVVTDTASGGQAVTWETVINCAARVDGAKASGPEPLTDGGIRTPRDYNGWIRSEIMIRHRLTPLDRVRWTRHGVTRLMNIADIPDQGLRGNLIAVICRAGMNEG